MTVLNLTELQPKTFKPVRLEIGGFSTISLWGGGVGEMEMTPFEAPLNATLTELKNGVNDGGFGCERILEAVLEVAVVYQHITEDGAVLEVKDYVTSIQVNM
jgi:hypothetical protein